jgi:hypothetical protein
MDGLRMVPVESGPAPACDRCGATGQRWDRIGGRPYCPDCEESLIRGEGAPLVVATEKHRCRVCDCAGTVPYQTLPLDTPALLALDLCPRHFRDLLGRRLAPSAVAQLRRQLRALNLRPDQVFLLHEAFYDAEGRAQLPVHDD